MTGRDFQLSENKRLVLLRVMQDLGYEQNHLPKFEWQKKRLQNGIAITRLVYRIKKVEHFFEFDCSSPKKWRLRYTGNIPAHSKRYVVSTWHQVLTHFRPWADNLLSEINSNDALQFLLSPIPLATPVVNNGTDMFTTPEKMRIISELDQLRAKIQERFRLASEQKSYLHAIFNILKNSLSTLARSPWTHTFIGLAAAIGLELGVAFVNNEPLWQMFQETLKRITETLALPG